jgi:hypothetical protein
MNPNLRLFQTLFAAATLSLAASLAAAGSARPLSALSHMPVKELTVFKDGHAFVLHGGKMDVDDQGCVVLDYLPTPIMGTFWPFSNDKACKLQAVTSAQRRVSVERTALTIRELLEANVGSEAVITENIAAGVAGQPAPEARADAGASVRSGPVQTAGTILGILARGSEEMEKNAVPGSGDLLPQKSNLLLLKTPAGTKAIPVERVLDVTIKGQVKKLAAEEEFRNLLTLKLDWAGKKPARSADVGMLYLQRGFRWIPNYRVSIDGKGSAVVKLQATLLNELTDMENATCHLVIGVPSFYFKGTNDPMALQQALVKLSPYFQEDSQMGSQAVSNVMMTQVARMSEVRRPEPAAPAAADLGPEIAGGEKAEDLYVFTVKNVTLRKGQRMVVPVAETTVPYKDVYVLDIPFSPPQEVFRAFNSNQQSEVARMLAAPKVMHKIRLENKSTSPFTTAPALLLKEDRLLAQGLMTYTSPGACTDIGLTASVDVQVTKTDVETRREPHAERWNGDDYMRVDLSGTITLTSHRAKPLELIVVRHVLGNATSAEQDGKIEMVNVLEDPTYAPTGDGAGPYGYPHWWRYYAWPWWWRHFNGMGRATWTVTLEPRKPVELKYKWNYYWR